MILAKLQNIESVELNTNQLTSIPKEISKLKLKLINLSDNFFDTFPKEVTNITTLKNLCISNNKITIIPKEIGNLKKMRFIDLSNNLLTTIPKEICRIKKLWGLNISGNLIASLPIGLKNMNCCIYVGVNPTDELREYVKNWKNIYFSNF